MTDRILLTCMGNICRSPLAEGILKAKAKEAGLDLYVDSAGTGGWHAGDRADARAVVAARMHGIDISEQKARMLRSQDFDAFDLIVVMDNPNKRDAEKLRPPGNEVPVRLMTSYLDDSEVEEVPDPYYSGQFEPVIALLDKCLDALVAQLLAERQ